MRTLDASHDLQVGFGHQTSSDAESGVRARVTLDGGADVGGIARRYLSPSERDAFESLPEQRRVSWLLGRVAAKQAVSRHLVCRDRAAIDPAAVVVENDRHGCPIVHVAGARSAGDGLRVSIAHKPSVAVAAAATLHVPQPSPDGAGAPCSGIGIDIEAVNPRSRTFERTVLSIAERSLRPGSDDDRDTWLTRLWTVKEAAAKATGLGLRGRPKDFEIDGVAGPAFRCRRGWIMTEPLVTAHGRFVVAWTETEPPC